MTRNATSLTSWARAIQVTLEQAGINSPALFAQAGLDPAQLADPNARYDLEGTTALWALARQATGNPNLGLDVGRNINQTTFHALGFSLMASRTLEDAFERLLRYFRIVSDAAELEFSACGDEYRFVIHPLARTQQPADEAIDAMMSVIIRTCRLLAGPRFAATRVTFRRQKPEDTTVFEKVFRAPLRFAAEHTAIYMHRDTALEPLPAANAELARHNDQILAHYLTQLDKENLANRVHALLVEQMPNGEPSQERIARELHMSLRNLQRRLGAEGTSYTEILDSTRRQLALDYISSPRYSINEITYLLGYSDASSFHRAFKRWTGKSPRDYRAALVS